MAKLPDRPRCPKPVPVTASPAKQAEWIKDNKAKLRLLWKPEPSKKPGKK